METESRQSLQSLRAQYTHALLDVLFQDVQRIERHYPAACLGLSSVCEERLALFHNPETASASAIALIEEPADTRDPAHELGILEVQRTLSLVPRHEYRKRRRELGRRLRHLRYSGTPVLRGIVATTALLLDGLEDGLLAVCEMTERVNSHRTILF